MNRGAVMMVWLPAEKYPLFAVKSVRIHSPPTWELWTATVTGVRFVYEIYRSPFKKNSPILLSFQW